MRIRLAAISTEDLISIRPWVDKLRHATNVGDMESMDAATEELLAWTREKHYVDLSEEEWQTWTANIRTGNPIFKSDYLVSAELCSSYFPDATPGTIVLQIPFDQGERGDV